MKKLSDITRTEKIKVMITVPELVEWIRSKYPELNSVKADTVFGDESLPIYDSVEVHFEAVTRGSAVE